jgi:DNA polymerase I-like protein with 3'-5' exonuclease and polymerase domains
LWFADNPGEGYKGINALIQGGCADFMSVVLLRCNQILEKQGWGYIVSVIHDEVLFEIQDDYLEIAAAVLSRAMEGEDIFGLPFATDVEVGDSYGTLEDFPLMVNVSEIDWRDYV